MRQGSSKELLALSSARSHTYTHIYARDCSKGRHSKPEDGFFLCAPFSAMLRARSPVQCIVRPGLPTSIRLALRNQLHSQQTVSVQSRPQALSNEGSSHRAMTRSAASRRIGSARFNYKEVFRLQPCRGHGGLFRMKTTIDVANLIERVSCPHHSWSASRNAERLPGHMPPY